MKGFKIKNGTVIRFKISGKHDFSHAVIVPSDRWGGSRLKDYNPEKMLVGFMGYNHDFIFKSEVIDKVNLKKLRFEVNFSDRKNGITRSYNEYLESINRYNEKIENQFQKTMEIEKEKPEESPPAAR